jgi:hypothetical protein
MGQRQLANDAQAGHVSTVSGQRLDPNFKLEYFDLTTALNAKGLKQPDYEYHKFADGGGTGHHAEVQPLLEGLAGLRNLSHHQPAQR